MTQNKIIVNILANKHATSTRHLFPLKVFQKDLKDLGIHVNFHYNLKSPSLNECNILLCFDGSYRDLLLTKNKDRQAAIRWLEKISENVNKLIWFDDGDSSGSLRTYVFPFITTYSKAQVLKDFSYYTKGNLVTGVLHRDFVLDLIEEPERVSYKGPISNNELGKINLGWSLALNSWKYNNCYNKIIDELIVKNLHSFSLRYTEPNLKFRPIDISYRGSMWAKIPTVNWWRKQTLQLLTSYLTKKTSVISGGENHIDKKQFHKEIQNSKITLSPFGIGEICFRDFECFINGSLLIKPNMDHLLTWPALYIDGVTYLSHKWDFSDFNEKLDSVLSNPERYEEIAREGQIRFQDVLTNGQEFARHFLSMITT